MLCLSFASANAFHYCLSFDSILFLFLVFFCFLFFLLLTFVSHQFPGEFGEGESEGLDAVRSGENGEYAARSDEK